MTSTEPTKIEEGREGLSANQQEMLSVVSHELRSPLMCLYALCEEGTDQLSPKAEAQATFLRIREQVRRIDFATRDLLSSFSPSLDKLKCIPRTFDFSRLIQIVVANIDLEYSAKKNISIELDLPEEPVLGCWDPSRMEQMLQNLISNAIKYAKPEGAKVRIQLKNKGDQSIQLSVQDQGLGIEPSDLKKVFRVFERGTQISDFQIPGFGIGLRLVDQIVRLHQGKISVRSEVNGGTEFTIQLPIHSLS